MKIAFVIRHVGEETDVIQKLAMVLVEHFKSVGDTVTVFPFTRYSLFKPFPRRKLKEYDAIVISNVGLQCAYYCFFKKIGFTHKPFVAISFGSDIRQKNNRWINLFNKLSVKQINLLIVINPDLIELAKERGYKNVKYVPTWSEAIV